MKKILSLFLLSILCLSSGCINIMTRRPNSGVKIDEIYLPTRYAISLFSAYGSDHYMHYPIFIIDGACEACLDTIFLPIDATLWYIRKPEKDEHENQENSFKFETEETIDI